MRRATHSLRLRGTVPQEGATVDDDRPDPVFDAMTARLLRREALRRAAAEMNTTSGPGLESILARISAEITAEAAEKKASPAAAGKSQPQS
jgi:hypothetical protein